MSINRIYGNAIIVHVHYVSFNPKRLANFAMPLCKAFEEFLIHGIII